LKQQDITQSMKSFNEVKEELNRLHKELSWRQIAKLDSYAGVKPGTLCAIAKGREPVDIHIRSILSLPAYLPTPVCPVCGIVHVKKCPHKNHKPKNIQDMSIKELLWSLENREEV